VQVIRVDPENHRIALSRKRRLPNPWDTVEERYHPGAIVPAKITRVVDFGAFAQLEPGVEGLIHISELADIAVAEPLKTVQVGDEVYCKILRVDSNRQRIGLSIRQVLDSERAELEAAEEELEDEELEAAEEAEEELEDEESDAMEAEAVAEALEEVSDEDASESADELSAEMNQDSSELAVEAEPAEEADGDKQTSE
jgi:predicted RNA-binding protein with RPS1 domain